MEYRIGSIGEAISGKSVNGQTKTLDFVPHKLAEKKKSRPTIKSNAQKRPTIKSNAQRRPTIELNAQRRPTIELSYAQKRPTIELSNAQRRVENKKRFSQNKPTIHDAEEEARTIFIGNLPNYLKKLDVKKHFRKYGKIENIRFRCAPIADLKIPKRVAVITKEFHPSRTTINGFIRYMDIESAKNALASNGDIIDGHHIRVDLSLNETPDFKKSIFIGNIPVAAEEEEIWKMFEYCGKVMNVRLIRDRQTGILKGFGYVNFDSKDAVEIALKMDGEKLKGRELRIQRCKEVKGAGKPQFIANKYKTPIKKENMDKRQKSIKKDVNKGDSKGKEAFKGRQALAKKIKKKKRLNREDKKKKIIKSKLLPKEKKNSSTTE